MPSLSHKTMDCSESTVPTVPPTYLLHQGEDAHAQVVSTVAVMCPRLMEWHDSKGPHRRQILVKSESTTDLGEDISAGLCVKRSVRWWSADTTMDAHNNRLQSWEKVHAEASALAASEWPRPSNHYATGIPSHLASTDFWRQPAGRSVRPNTWAACSLAGPGHHARAGHPHARQVHWRPLIISSAWIHWVFRRNIVYH